MDESDFFYYILDNVLKNKKRHNDAKFKLDESTSYKKSLKKIVIANSHTFN